MHELSIAQQILNIALKHAGNAEAIQIKHIYLRIGQLSSIIDDSLQFYWDFISDGTIAKGAALHFERIPANLICNNCQHAYILNGKTMSCPQCGSEGFDIQAGAEFSLLAIDIETNRVGVEQ